jgi:hypothetical protein
MGPNGQAVPTCAEVTLAEIGDEVTGGIFKSQAAEQGLKAAGEAQAARAVRYASGRTNFMGGKGLAYANKSSVFRRMMKNAKFLGEASEALPVLETGYAAGKSIAPVSQAAREGNCAAALPVF